MRPMDEETAPLTLLMLPTGQRPLPHQAQKKWTFDSEWELAPRVVIFVMSGGEAGALEEETEDFFGEVICYSPCV